jgi:hypothetical protein
MLERVSNREVRGERCVVTVDGIHIVRYSEDGRSAHIDIEGGTDAQGRINWAVYAATLRGWDEPREPMSAEDRDRVLDTISRSLDLLDMTHIIV